MMCDWLQLDERTWQCRRCRRAVDIRKGDPSAILPKIKCRGKVVTGKGGRCRVGVIRKALGWVSAASRWVAAGRPERSQEEIDRIYLEVCLPCPWFAPDPGGCGVCGCRLSRRRRALMNKIAMATENCPKKRW